MERRSGWHAGNVRASSLGQSISMKLHAGSLKRNEDSSPYLCWPKDLVPYLVEMNYTHVEIHALMAHPWT